MPHRVIRVPVPSLEESQVVEPLIGHPALRLMGHLERDRNLVHLAEELEDADVLGRVDLGPNVLGRTTSVHAVVLDYHYIGTLIRYEGVKVFEGPNRELARCR